MTHASETLHSDAHRRLTRTFSAAVLAIGLLQVIVVWYFASRAIPKSDGWERAYALSAGIAGAAVWWAAFARYAETEVRRLLTTQLNAQRKQLTAEQDRLLKELQDELRAERSTLSKEIHSRDVPSRVYEGHDGFDLRFTRDLSRDLSRSEAYYFRGVTGIYIGARLVLRPSDAACRLRGTWLKLIDPRSELAMRYARAELRRRPKHRQMKEAQLEALLRNQLLMAIVALFDARHEVDRIVIAHDPGPVVHRTELFDDAVYDTQILERDENFPRAWRWERTQRRYDRFLEEMREHMRLFPGTEFTPSTTEDMLTEHLEHLGLGIDGLAAARQQYMREYLDILQPVLADAAGFSEEFVEKVVP